MKTKTMVLCAIFAAIICIFSVMTIPIGPVPITMGTFGVMLTAAVLGHKRAPASVLIFVLLGAVGLPVFSGFKGGFQVLLGPTGGYIWSYILMALIIGIITKELPQKKYTAMLKTFGACIIGIAVCYLLGTAQFMLVQKANIVSALSLCVIPFIPFDLLKAALVAYLGYVVRTALNKSGRL